MPISKEEYKERINLHKQSVKAGIQRIIIMLSQRGDRHDNSKFSIDEFDGFYNINSKMSNMKFGSPEYISSLSEIKETLDIHYKNNSHHPQHFENGISGMDLIDLIEMIVDWKSASYAYDDSETTFEHSLEINRERFNIDNQLYSILLNTAKNLGYI